MRRATVFSLAVAIVLFAGLVLIAQDRTASGDSHDAAPVIHSVEPMPPYCAVSEASDLSDRLVVITGENLIAGEEPHVQLRNLLSARNTIHLGHEINWEGSDRITFDLDRIKQFVLSHSLLQVQVRITDGPIGGYKPLSEWSETFFVAYRAEDCPRQREPTPTPSPTLHPYSDAQSYSNRDPYSDTHAQSHRNSNSSPDPYSDSYTQSHCNPNSNPKPRCQALLRQLNPVPRQPQFLFQPLPRHLCQQQLRHRHPPPLTRQFPPTR